MLKGNNGVTLVALVITIIVLLILAGVSISLVVGDNGVLSQATSAADETNKAKAKEQVEMAVASVVADWTEAKYVENSDASLQSQLTKTNLEKNMTDVTITEPSFSDGTASVTVTYGSQTYTCDIVLSTNTASVQNFE